MTSLLPPNAGAQEAALSEVTQYSCVPDGLHGFKFAPTDAILPWLIWEYGLGDIAQWVKDPKQLLEEGVAFQRLRGTPKALQIAMGWMNLQCDIEEEPPGAHFSEFQLCLDSIPAATEHLCDVINLAIPARSRLSRMYNEHYDVRRFMIGVSYWGDLLSDYSGVRLVSDGPKLSFGQTQTGEARQNPITVQAIQHRQNVSLGIIEDTYRLDFAILGETQPHVPNEIFSFIRQHVVCAEAQERIPRNNIVLAFRFAKTQIILSESEVLGDLNACFAASDIAEIGESFEVDYQKLSHHFWRFHNKEILERSEITHNQTIPMPLAKLAENTKDRNVWVENTAPAMCPAVVHDVCHCVLLEYTEPNIWHQHRHCNQAWNQQHAMIGAH